MKIAIIREDGMVVVDGVGRQVDLSAMSGAIHAVHWDGARERGEVEYETIDLPVFEENGEGEQVQIGVRPGRPNNLVLQSFDSFSWAYDGWVAAAPPAPVPPTLAEIKASAKSEIDSAAGAARKRYITSVAGQDAVYLVKAQEAEAYVAAGYTGDVPPHLAAEAAAIGQTPQYVADLVLGTRAAWLSTLSPAIEGARIGGKAAVNAASDAAGVQSALNSALATLGAI
jgi:hypothetical protein